MTIKQQGGIFGRNPTFYNVEVDGNLSGTTVDLVNSGASTQKAITLTNNSTSFNAGSAISFEFDSDSQEYTQIEATPRNGSQGYLLVKNLFGGVLTQALTLDGVDLKIDAGNLVIGTSGKGIDFSATSGTGTSELFDDYEEGTWTPTQGTFTTWTSPTFDAKYTKIGRLVTLTLRQTGGTISSGGANYIEGLPYTPLQGGAGSASSGTLAALGSILAWTNGRLYFTAATGSQTSLVATVTYEA